MNIGLLGDFDEAVTAHKAIPLALQLAADELEVNIEYQWLHSQDIEIRQLEEYSCLWCVPASPYENTDNVLEAIKFAREQDVPFLGTCGGYQHAALEFARNVLGFSEAGNSEITPDSSMPVISGLVCKLYDVAADIELSENSVIASAYGALNISEEYFCGYGVNRDYLHLYNNSALNFTGHDVDGDPRALEISANRFYVGTAFQPERSAFNKVVHPLIRAYLISASERH